MQQGLSQRYFPDIREAKDLVIKTLREYGSQSYSRLLMRTGLPEEILEKALERLLDEKTLQSQVEDEERVYAMLKRQWF